MSNISSAITSQWPPILTRPRALLFDWDSTLVNNWKCIEEAINTTLVAMDHPPWTSEEIRARVRESMRESFPRLFGERWESAKRIFYEAIRLRHLLNLEALPGAEDLLKDLAEDGLYLGVVSNKTGEFLRREVNHLGWDRYFRCVVGAGDAVRDKPDPAPVALALEGSGIEPGRDVWFVGDTALDMLCARNAGCIPILVTGQGQGMDDFSPAPPACEFANCFELRALVRRL